MPYVPGCGADVFITSQRPSQLMRLGCDPSTLRSRVPTLRFLGIVGSIDDMNAGSSYKLTKIGGGNVILSGANTYAGLTEVQQGALVIDNPLALGSPTNGTVVDNGAAIDLQSSLVGEPITLNGDGFSFNGHNTGALRNLSNINTYNGILTLNSAATVGVDSGTQLTIGGSSYNVTFGVNGAQAAMSANATVVII